MNTSTPRTDAAWSGSFDGEQMSAGQTARALRECSQKLETELADQTKRFHDEIVRRQETVRNNHELDLKERDHLLGLLAIEREKVRLLREALSDAQSAALPRREWPWTEGAK